MKQVTSTRQLQLCTEESEKLKSEKIPRRNSELGTRNPRGTTFPLSEKKTDFRVNGKDVISVFFCNLKP